MPVIGRPGRIAGITTAQSREIHRVRRAGPWEGRVVPEDHFAGLIARTYDASSADMYAPEVLDPTADLLADLAGDRPALEFAIGTGRVAMALRERGVTVAGIELSPDMVDQLRRKPGSEDIEVTIGDIADTRVDGEFGLVYLVFNTIGNLVTQDRQVACFENAAAHLGPGGCFVVEVLVPPLRQLPPGQTARVFEHTPHHLGFDELDVVTQFGVSHHHFRIDGRWEVWSMPWRYVWPSELDLMARLAGLRLRSRWADWTGAPFTADSASHVSVWEKPA